MLMPGRNGYAADSGWTNNSGSVSNPDTLTVNFRAGNTPSEYKARAQINFIEGFESATGDYFVAYITDEASGGSDSSSNNGSEGNGYRYGFNGQEKSDDVTAGNYTAEYWEYDPRLGRRWNVEPLIAKYPNLSGYATFSNNPINATDPNGQDVILLTWATKGGDVGHTAIAIQNYKTEKIKVKGKWQTIMTPLNSYNVYEIGPGKSLLPNELNSIVPALSPISRNMTKEQILKNKGSDGKPFIQWDGNAPDGVIEFKTDAKYDARAQNIMEEKAWTDRLGYKAVGGDGKSSDNCTSYVEEVIPRASNEAVSGSEVVELPNGKKVSSEMPTQLFKSASKLKTAKILRDIPTDLKNKSFKQAYFSPQPSNAKNEKKKM